MNVFRLSPGILLIFFTLPALFFSEFPAIISILLFLFFLSYLFFLSGQEMMRNKESLLRNKIECVLLLIIYGSSAIAILIGKEIQLGEIQKVVFSIIYLAIFIDLAVNLSGLLLKNNNDSTDKGKTVLIFFCLLVPPLGIYYLRNLYLKWSSSPD